MVFLLLTNVALASFCDFFPPVSDKLKSAHVKIVVFPEPAKHIVHKVKKKKKFKSITVLQETHTNQQQQRWQAA